MTVATPPRPPAPAGADPRRAAPPPPTRPTLVARVVSDPSFGATAVLTLLTLAGGVGFARLFSSGPFLGPVVLAILAAHAVAFWCRRNELPTPAAAVATIGAAALTGSWTVLGHTTAYGVPIPYTLRVALEELERAQGAFNVVRPPTPALAGFVIALVLAIGVVVFMSDWAAFRLQTAAEAVVPSFTLFVFSSVLARGRGSALAFAAFTAAALLFLAVHGLNARGRVAWFGGRPAVGTSWWLRTATTVGAVAVVVGVVVGPLLPLAGSAPWVSTTNKRPGPSSRSTVSPLVEIRGRLQERRDIEVFTVRASEPAYWRLTSLDTFNGSIWSSNTTYRSTRGGLGTNEPGVEAVPSARVTQQFRVRALASIWLPAAYRPQRVRDIRGVSYNSDTASLITEDTTTDGYEYRVESARPVLTPELLDTAPAQAPAAIADRYLRLPPLSERVRNEARRIVRGAPTPYRRALALQNYFIDNFRYDLEVTQGHSREALENFLFRNRRGYCEQFAGAYAVLAREVGLPARVAVGFTPGDLTTDGTYSVRELHAHAWPEVYLHGFGWVAFEPTPPRGAPGNESYTGRAPAQDRFESAVTATTAPGPATTAPGDLTPSTAPPDPAGDSGAGGDGGAGGRRVFGVPAALVTAGAPLVLLALYLAVVPSLHALRWRRRRQAPTAADRVMAAWEEASEVLAVAGVRRRPGETMTEFAARAPASAGFQPEAAAALRTLSEAAAAAAYAGVDVPEGVSEAAASSTRAVTAAVNAQVTWFDRARRWLDPRPLLRAGT